MSLPEYCVHRTVPELPHVTCEKAQVGMKVAYRPAGGKAEVGVIQRIVTPRAAYVLYLGDLHAKYTSLQNLHYWEGPQ